MSKGFFSQFQRLLFPNAILEEPPAAAPPAKSNEQPAPSATEPLQLEAMDPRDRRTETTALGGELSAHEATSAGLPPLAIDVFAGTAAPEVVCHRFQIKAPRVAVSSLAFEAPPKLLPPKKTPAMVDLADGAGDGLPMESAEQPPTKVSRGRVPAGVPLRERVLSILQPPVQLLMGDRDVYVPFKPFPYQFNGIHFLSSRWSALLADEMGLGKTMQAILAIRLLLRAGLIRSSLLVCPKPLVTNWMREFETWAPEIPVLPVAGDTWKRRNAWIHDRRPVKIANYESITRDEDVFADGQVSMDLVVLDEAQRIKNRDSKTATVVHKIRRKRSWVLTGTPVENSAADLISLLEFANNDRNIVTETRPSALREALSEILLRRTKEMVHGDMPKKMIRDVPIDLGTTQRQRYDLAEKEGIIQLSELGEQIELEHVFELIGRLKQICNFDPVTGESAKAEVVKADMEEIAASGSKAILFSQWVTTLEMLGDYLREFHPMMYHGKMNTRERDATLKRFKEDPNENLLMLSYATGAVGLNIQFSNYVFLFDRWWNPAVEDQAINRAHRVGQKSTVFVSRFVTPDTIEERIAKVLQEKRDLFEYMVDERDIPFHEGIKREDVLKLFDLKTHG